MEKKHSEGISAENNKFISWLDNYWYHYKWPTIVVAFFLVVVVICTVQTCKKDNNDIIITYAGPVFISDAKDGDLERVLSKALPDEFSKKRSAKAELLTYYVLSEEQIKAMRLQKHPDGTPVFVDTSFHTEQLEQFNSQTMTGSGSVLLLDKWLYNTMFDESGNTKRLTPLSEVFGETPEGAIDAYGIRLGDTELYKTSPEFSSLPEDTVICLHSKIISQKNYGKEIIAFKAFVNAPVN